MYLMKNKMRNQLEILNYISSTDRFKLIFFMIIFLSLYASVILGVSKNNIIDSIFIPFSFSVFNIFMFSLLFFNTLNTCSCFDKNFNFYIMRLKTKNSYIKELCKMTVILNLFFFLLFFIFYFMVLNVLKLGNLNIHPYLNYSISNLAYAFFYLFRYLLLSVLITILSALCYINFKEKITIIINTIFLMGFMIVSNGENVRSSFSIIPWSYFTGVPFFSFSIELVFSILYLLLLLLLIRVCYNLTLKNKKWVIS